ncbi:MAG: A/G-specific adenine glycosylase [Phycisphaerae bacterium]|nr:A/G-specific adenine glycosylase [Phycisphaerae bacterium]
MAARRSDRRAVEIARPLLRWYRRVRRRLPWRETRDPYAIWVSETMLQQTQVGTVIPYYERFMRRFPTVRALAAAPLGDVLRFWAGLGYYARARNLHAAARDVVARFDGRVPSTVEELLTLPGVGRYTAGAVASIAFGARATVVDGNVARVLARWHAMRGDVKSAAMRQRLWRAAESMLPARGCGDFNQALMELGATVCTPIAPQCEVCPLRGGCRALARGLADRIPRPARRTMVQRETHVVAAVSDGERWLFVRRPRNGLWGGLWELPTLPVARTRVRDAVQEVLRRRELARARIESRPFVRATHALSHRRIEFVGYRCRVERTARVRGGRWCRLNRAERLGLSRAMQRVVAALRELVGANDGGLPSGRDRVA